MASSGNVTEEVIAEYIKNLDWEERNNSDDFERSGLGIDLAARRTHRL